MCVYVFHLFRVTLKYIATIVFLSNLVSFDTKSFLNHYDWDRAMQYLPLMYNINI